LRSSLGSGKARRMTEPISPTYTKVALARFVFGTDGSAQKSTTAYRPVKQLPQNWVRAVSWLDKGKIHVVVEDPMRLDSKMSYFVQPEASPGGHPRIGSVDVADTRTILIRIAEDHPHVYDVLPSFSTDPFGSNLRPVDCNFDLQILRKVEIPLIGEPPSFPP